MRSPYFKSRVNELTDKDRVENFRRIVRLSKTNYTKAVEELDDMLENVFFDFLSNNIPNNERNRRKSDFRSKFWGLVRRYKACKMGEKKEVEERFLENWRHMIRPLHGD